jgi:hypothetical protein
LTLSWRCVFPEEKLCFSPPVSLSSPDPFLGASCGHLLTVSSISPGPSFQVTTTFATEWLGFKYTSTALSTPFGNPSYSYYAFQQWWIKSSREKRRVVNKRQMKITLKRKSTG